MKIETLAKSIREKLAKEPYNFPFVVTGQLQPAAQVFYPEKITLAVYVGKIQREMTLLGTYPETMARVEFVLRFYEAKKVPMEQLDSFMAMMVATFQSVLPVGVNCLQIEGGKISYNKEIRLHYYEYTAQVQLLEGGW